MANEQERAELEQLRLQYPAIAQAILDFEISLEASAMASAISPAPRVKAALLDSLSFEEEEDTSSQNPTAIIAPMAAEIPVIRTSWLRYVAAASVILLVISAATNVYFYKQFQNASNNYQALLIEKNSLLAQNEALQTKGLDLFEAMQIMSDPAFTKVSMPGIKPEENKLATVFWNQKEAAVYLLTNKLPQTTGDTQYQLWAIVDGKPVDAGMIDACTGLCKMKNIPKASAFAITLEKRGGSPTPNLQQLQVIGNVAS